MVAFHQFTDVKKTCTEKNILKCSQISILKIFFVPNAFSGCNLRVGKFDVSASKIIIFIQAQVNGQWKRIMCSQLLQAHIA